MGFKLADFFVELGVEGDTMTLGTMVNQMSDLKLETLGEITALGALGVALKNAGMHAMELGVGYSNINRQYDTNINMLQRWQNVARASNVPVEDVAKTFTSMQQKLASPFIGDPNSAFNRAAGLLGVRNANRMTTDQLNEALRVAVPEYVRRMSPTQGRANALTNAGSLIEEMGATRSMVQMYMLSPGKFQRGEQTSPIFSDQDVRQWAELSAQVAIVSHNLFMMAEEIMSSALPELIKWSTALIESEGFIKKRFGTAGDVLTLPHAQTGPNNNMTPFSGSVLAALIAPDYVRRNATPLNVTQHNKVDIHAHGGDAADMARRHKNEFDKSTQDDLTRAAQLLNTQQAY